MSSMREKDVTGDIVDSLPGDFLASFINIENFLNLGFVLRGGVTGQTGIDRGSSGHSPRLIIFVAVFAGNFRLPFRRLGFQMYFMIKVQRLDNGFRKQGVPDGNE